MNIEFGSDFAISDREIHVLSPQYLMYRDTDAGGFYLRILEIDVDGEITGINLTRTTYGGFILVLSENKFAIIDTSSTYKKVVVGVWDGSSITFAAEHTGPSISITVGAAMLTDSIFVCISSTQAAICSVNGTTISCYTPETYATAEMSGISVCALGGDRFALAFHRFSATHLNTFFIVGDRSGGTTIAFGDALDTARASAHSTPLSMVSSDLFVCFYRGSDGYGYAGTASVSDDETITLGTAVLVNTEKIYDGPLGCRVLPPVEDTMWPRKFVISYTEMAVYPLTAVAIYIRVGDVSEAGVVSFTESRVQARTGSSTYPVLSPEINVIAQSDFVMTYGSTYVPSTGGYVFTAAIDSLTLDVEFCLGDTLPVSSLSKNTANRSLSEALSVYAEPGTLLSKIQNETLSLSDTTTLLLLLELVLEDDINFYDVWDLGGDAGFRKTIYEAISLSDQAIKNPNKLVEDIIDIRDRLRLGGVFDNPVSRVATAILKARIKSERL